jgi:4-hydroxy-2-oxoheptanedioate aldolase
MHHANANITVIVQIESELGVENAQEIASVPGIDMLFIGPNDLCCSMGYFAFDHKNVPRVQEAAIKVRDAAKQEGKYAGYFCLSAEDAAQRARMGFEFVNCGADIVAISAWMGSEMTKLNDLLASNHTTNEVLN